MEIGEGEGRAEGVGAVLCWFFMEEDEEWVNNVDLKDGCVDTRVEPLEG